MRLSLQCRVIKQSGSRGAGGRRRHRWGSVRRLPASFGVTGEKSDATGLPHDPGQGRSGRAAPNRRYPPRCRLVRRPASGSREVARRHIEQSPPRPGSVLHPDTRRRRCSKLEREGADTDRIAEPRNDRTPVAAAYSSGAGEDRESRLQESRLLAKEIERSATLENGPRKRVFSFPKRLSSGLRPLSSVGRAPPW